jgi:hypothetical protein
MGKLRFIFETTTGRKNYLKRGLIQKRTSKKTFTKKMNFEKTILGY